MECRPCNASSSPASRFSRTRTRGRRPCARPCARRARATRLTAVIVPWKHEATKLVTAWKRRPQLVDATGRCLGRGACCSRCRSRRTEFDHVIIPNASAGLFPADDRIAKTASTQAFRAPRAARRVRTRRADAASEVGGRDDDPELHPFAAREDQPRPALAYGNYGLCRRCRRAHPTRATQRHRRMGACVRHCGAWGGAWPHMRARGTRGDGRARCTAQQSRA